MLSEQQLNCIILELIRKQAYQTIQKCNYLDFNFSKFLPQLSKSVNIIRNNHRNFQGSPLLQLTNQQIDREKQSLIQQLKNLSKTIYSTSDQEIYVIFPPFNTSMIILLQNSSIILINPCNLSSWYLEELGLSIDTVDYIVITRYSMAFMEFFLAWGSLSKHKKYSRLFLNIITFDNIYSQIKKTLQQIFYWFDEKMIQSKLGFHIIPTQIEPNFRIKQQKLVQYKFGNRFKAIYHYNSHDKSLQIKFGNKSIFLFHILTQISELDYFLKDNAELIIIDLITEDAKSKLYSFNQSVGKKIIYNRATKHKFNNKYLYRLKEEDPTIKIVSDIKIGEIFLPYFKKKESQRYKKIWIKPGQVINCQGKNIIISNGLILALKDIYMQQKSMINTEVKICLSSNFIKNGYLQDFNLMKIDTVDQIIGLKQSIILMEDKKQKIIYDNQQLNPLAFENKENNSVFLSELQSPSLRSNKQTIFKRLLAIKFSQTNLFKVKQNSLVNSLNRSAKKLNHFEYNGLSDQQNTSIETVQVHSPFYQLDRLFSTKTFESGSIINKENDKAYFIIKGQMRWKLSTNEHENDENVAKNGAFIGNLKSYYYEHMKTKQYLGQPFYGIEVVKDTWSLQCSIKELHQIFWTYYPEVLTDMIEKGKIFY